MELIKGGKGILIGKEGLDLDQYPDLVCVGCNMTSTEHLPVAEMKKRGIKFFSLFGETEFLESITSTAEHCMGLIISLSRNYKTALNAPYGERDSYIGHRLSGKTLGIIGGKGRISSQITKVAHSLGMKVIHYDIKD